MTFPALALSHFELFAQDPVSMERFYTQVLGFVVTDRGSGVDGLIFLSRNPDEHHQLVLNPHTSTRAWHSPLDHIAFRVASLADLRQFHRSLCATQTQVATVSHGTTWSLYFRDPQGNRLELFVDTPWHVAQPCKFPVDLSLSDDALLAATRAVVAELPGFCDVHTWRANQGSAIG